MDFLPNTEFSEAQASTIAALIGAVAATGLAALTTWHFSRRARLNERNDQEIARRRDTYRLTVDSITTLLSALDSLMILAARNHITILKYKEGIYDKKTHTLIRHLNTPKTYEINSELGYQIYNAEVQKYWANLMIELGLQNIIVTEFNEYYKGVRTEIHKIRLNNHEPSMTVIEADSAAIKIFADDSISATSALENKIIYLISLIELFQATLTKSTRDIHIAEEFRGLLDDMFSRKPEEPALQAKIAHYSEMYEDPEKVFTGKIG